MEFEIYFYLGMFFALVCFNFTHIITVLMNKRDLETRGCVCDYIIAHIVYFSLLTQGSHVQVSISSALRT